MEEDVATDIAAFERKRKLERGGMQEDSSSSEGEEVNITPGTQSEEVQRLKFKVDLLMRQVVDKETELSSFKQALQLTKVDDEAGGADPKGKKLLELARKNRALQVALESEKNRSAAAMAEVIRLQETLNLAENSKAWKRQKVVVQEEDYKQRFISLEKNYQELKLKHHTTKEELKRAEKVVRQEVGEYESLAKLIANEGWRGRAQTIDSLRGKVRDLERQLAAAKAAQSDPGETSTSRVGLETGGAEERRREIVALKEALQVANAECDGWKKKAQGALSRKTALEDDMRKLREGQNMGLKTLMEKSETDDRLIASLKEELERSRRAKGVPVKIKVGETGSEDFISQIKLLRARVYTLESELREKEGILEMFKLNEGEGQLDDAEDYRGRLRELQAEIDRLQAANREMEISRSQTSSEEAKIIKDLSVQNVRLRKKADDLEQQLRAKK